ncbi:hypothetical protein CDAR_271991 [Caerostris darwini]|uniref:Uncharacterized protein n=1 Tax=Caerostris darwini TaxID=1538125 RepID=A0AAV4W6Y0_9ARAC|nr:hypothetical protein CDAR_271991 [Caerostris darwini]
MLDGPEKDSAYRPTSIQLVQSSAWQWQHQNVRRPGKGLCLPSDVTSINSAIDYCLGKTLEKYMMGL